MAGTKNQNSFSMLDLSGGYQPATSHLLKKRQELFDSQNAVFNKVIGAAVRRDGYEQVGQIVQAGADSLFAGVYTNNGNNRIIVGVNNSNASNATLQFLDQGGNWTTILGDAAPNTRFHALNYLEEFYVCGETAGQYYPLTNIDSTMTPSVTRNVLGAPKCKFIAQYAGQLYAMNVQINGVTYRDRAYISSPALGVITQVQLAISGQATGMKVNSVKYLKVGMSIDIYGAQTDNLKYSGITITSVDKLNNVIGFIGQTVNISINDEVWIAGRHNQLTTLWNTDYPTSQAADWIRIPPGITEHPEFTGFTVNNNRLFMFSKNTMLKWDGTNLIVISHQVGCANHESISNIGSWTIWLHTSGVWGYNDTTGQLKMISRAVKPMLRRINPSNYQYTSSVITDDRIYKLALGQLMDPVLYTTSTSTSSTSTSSTSTSTSSTSTSSTSTSTIITTTSTSSTSSSTSTSISTSTSTSISSTSTSISTTSTSSTSSSTSLSTSSSTSTSTSLSTSTSSTSTVPTGKQCVRLCYDFDLNIWWYEVHNREQRYQFLHSMNGFRKPYFTDENGYLFRDETGYTDAGNPIPMVIESGRTNCGTEQRKTWGALQIDSESARGAQIYVSYDGSDWTTYPGWQLSDNIQTLNFPQSGQLKASRDIDVMLMHQDKGEPPAVNGFTIYFSLVESVVNEMGESK